MKYPYEMLDTKAADLISDEHARGWIEGAAMALTKLMHRKTGDSPSSKTYDPMYVWVEKGEISSYAFDLKDGGRHHPISDYEDLGEILEIMVMETLDWIDDDL